MMISNSHKCEISGFINKIANRKNKFCLQINLKKVSVLAVKYLLVILHCLPTDRVSQLAIPVVKYTGTWSNIADHSVEPVRRYLQS